MQTLAQHLTSQAVNDSLSQLILTLADTSKAISHAVRHGALAGVLGATEQENVQGETQKNWISSPTTCLKMRSKPTEQCAA